MKLSRVLLLGTSMLVSGAMPGLAYAQATDAPPQAAPADQSAATDKDGAPAEDIVVTGERNNQFGTDTAQSGSFRNAKILDIPMTVSVIPDALLKSQQAVDLIDAVRNTAGVSSSGVGPASYNNITIRGITVDTRSSYKLDGTLNILSSTAFPLEDKDRVEILKGASAIYYGFSPPSGIVNFVMKRPTPELYVGVRAFGDSNGGYGGHLDLGDTVGIFGFRINAVAARQDTGITFAKGDRYLASGTFDLKPTSNLTLSADVEWFKRGIVEPATFIIPNGATKLPPLAYLDPSKNIGGLSWDTNRTEELNLLFKGVWKVAKDWDVTAYWGRSHLNRLRYNPGFVPGNVTSLQTATQIATYNAAVTPGSPTFGAGAVRFGTNIQNAIYENISYAVELHGKITTGDITNNILIGASRSLRSLGGSPATPRTLVTGDNFLNPIIVPNPYALVAKPPIPSTIDDKGLYAFDDLSFKNIIHLTGGVRVTDYTNDGSTNSNTKAPYNVKPTAWSGGVIVKPMEWASLYGTYIQGLEENAIASNNVDNAQAVFPPISSTLYEAGLKLQPRKNLLIQLAYFDIKREGAYNERIDPVTKVLHGFGDATQTYRGFEGSVSGYVIPDLAINATLMLLKARTFQAANPNSPHTFPGGTPDVSWSLSGEYTVSWLTPKLKVSAGAFHTGKQAVDDTNKAFTDPYTTFDIGASYAFELGGHKLVARVNGQNITNKRYWAAVGGGALAESLPSTVKFSLAFNY
ncbi:TonB-dependent siderophore receptor [Sphingomonas sp.]|uniref:TonB-dependent siderophore receptor n=1 Tax=Sphingomonas sp. TaxID=28214 RepID=UPI0025E18030|nr:TonB-dependent receptor [Sphingomonas sp.]